MTRRTEELVALRRRSRQHQRLAEAMRAGDPIAPADLPDLDADWLQDVLDPDGGWDLEMVELGAALVESSYRQAAHLYAQWHELPLRGVLQAVADRAD